MMTEWEIAQNYKEAKHKTKQIRILADMNERSTKRMKKILIKAGAIQEQKSIGV